MSRKSRHVERFMPYACARDGLEFRSVRLAVDGQAHGELRPGDLLSAEAANWTELTLSVSVELRPGILARVLHADELHQPPVALVLAVRCPAAFMSRPYRIAHSHPSAENFEHDITLKRNDLRGEVMITPYLVRTLTGPRRTGHAWRKGAWLATAEPWILCIDEQKPPVGNNVEVLRRRFSEDPEIPVADRANWFYLQLEGEAPRLLLNDEHAELMRALHDTSTKGKRAAVRNALFELIDATVWPALLLHAARAWQENEGAAYQWQTNVLRLWAKRMFPDEDDLTSGVERLVRQALAAPSTFLLEVNAMLQRHEQVRLLDRLLIEVYQ